MEEIALHSFQLIASTTLCCARLAPRHPSLVESGRWQGRGQGLDASCWLAHGPGSAEIGLSAQKIN